MEIPLSETVKDIERLTHVLKLLHDVDEADKQQIKLELKQLESRLDHDCNQGHIVKCGRDKVKTVKNDIFLKSVSAAFKSTKTIDKSNKHFLAPLNN